MTNARAADAPNTQPGHLAWQPTPGGLQGLYSIKPAFRRSLATLAGVCVRGRVHPDRLTYAAVVAAAGIGAVLLASPSAPLLLWLVPPLVLVRLALNALDGMVAEASGLARPWGKVLNESCDRISDVLCLLPLAALPGACVGWSLAAVGAALATAYVRTLAEAAGAGRRYDGVMGKADRMLWLGVAAAAGALGQPIALTILPVAISLGGLWTIVERLRRTHAAL